MKIGAVVLLLFAATPFRADLHAQNVPSWALSEAESPEGHLKRIERQTKNGNKKAAYELGQMCAFGFPFPVKPDDMYRPLDLEQALHWFEIGAQTSYEKSQVAYMYAYGKPFPKNPEAAEHWFRSTANLSMYLKLEKPIKPPPRAIDPKPHDTTRKPQQSFSNSSRRPAIQTEGARKWNWATSSSTASTAPGMTPQVARKT